VGLSQHAAVDPTASVRRGLLGVEVVTTADVPVGHAYVADGSQVVAAVRTDGEIAVSSDAKFANYQTLIRVVSRINFGFPRGGRPRRTRREDLPLHLPLAAVRSPR
jgi:hypothetical protein